MFTYYFVLQDGHLYLWQASLQTSQVFDCISHSLFITKMIGKTKFCGETTLDAEHVVSVFFPRLLSKDWVPIQFYSQSTPLVLSSKLIQNGGFFR